MYINRTGCHWRNLPHDVKAAVRLDDAADTAKWKSVYNIYWQWRNDGTLEKVRDIFVVCVRKVMGKQSTPSAVIIDSSSANTAESGGEQRGYDAGKKISGRKRHLIVDTLGMIIAVVVHAASIQDQDGAKLLLQKIKEKNKRLLAIFADSAYIPEPVKISGLLVWVRE